MTQFHLDKLNRPASGKEALEAQIHKLDIIKEEFNSETIKHDYGKPDFTLIPQEALLETAKVFTLGAQKYGVYNYSLGTNYRRYIAAAQRHMNKWLRGEDLDEIGTNHLSNAIASLMMVLDNQITGKGIDDRNMVYKTNKSHNDDNKEK